MPATNSSPGTQPDGVTLDQLRDLFTGVPDDNGDWATTPCYTVPLAFEIAKRARTSGEYELRTLLFDTTAVDDVPGAALEVIRLAVQRYRSWRDLTNRRSLGTAA